jgi:hypothetical protein
VTEALEQGLQERGSGGGWAAPREQRDKPERWAVGQSGVRP